MSFVDDLTVPTLFATPIVTGIATAGRLIDLCIDLLPVLAGQVFLHTFVCIYLCLILTSIIISAIEFLLFAVDREWFCYRRGAACQTGAAATRAAGFCVGLRLRHQQPCNC